MVWQIVVPLCSNAIYSRNNLFAESQIWQLINWLFLTKKNLDNAKKIEKSLTPEEISISFSNSRTKFAKRNRRGGREREIENNDIRYNTRRTPHLIRA